MMTDACQILHCECTGYGTLLRPKPGDCCAFFSDGSGALSTRPGR
jgi:hypothetical protein